MSTDKLDRYRSWTLADFPLQIRAVRSTSGMMPKLIPGFLFKAGGRLVAFQDLKSETWDTHFRLEFAS
jgi:hypothetical protein